MEFVGHNAHMSFHYWQLLLLYYNIVIVIQGLCFWAYRKATHFFAHFDYMTSYFCQDQYPPYTNPLEQIYLGVACKRSKHAYDAPHTFTLNHLHLSNGTDLLILELCTEMKSLHVCLKCISSHWTWLTCSLWEMDRSALLYMEIKDDEMEIHVHYCFHSFRQ